MIVYHSTRDGFQKDILSGEIETIIEGEIKKRLFRSTAESELRAFRNSLLYMSAVIGDSEIPGNAGVNIEYQVPQTSRRIDFIISGLDEHNKEHAVIIELKQWESAALTEKDGIVKTYLGKTHREVTHPSYQAWSYASLLEDFNEAVYKGKIVLKPCAYLHNCKEDVVVRNPFYDSYLQRAPTFIRTDAVRLQEFIKRFVKKGDNGEVLYKIEKGRIRPSKMLADNLSSMLKGNKEFIMIDEQKVVYENALASINKVKPDKKQVLIVKGGPGTGKSVVAINLLVEVTKQGKLVNYVTKNAAPRAVFENKLTGSVTKSRIRNMFKGSGAFVGCKPDIFDSLIVDEAHRLNEKSGMFKNLGENQVKELIAASKSTVFFIDEDQRIALHDIGTIDEIIFWASKMGAEVTELELESQFRCNGSDGYLAWLDHILQIRETANTNLIDLNYDFRVLDSPAELRDLILEKNKESNKARMVAGYCWDWISKTNPKAFDIIFPEYDFAHQWNLSVDGSLWITKPGSEKEIGCIHTCQGLEVDYIGVIIGPDLIMRDGLVLTDPSKRSKMDSTIKGYKKLLKEHPEEAKERIRNIIKNTYRTLMTRGMKGCYVYIMDEEMRKWVREGLK